MFHLQAALTVTAPLPPIVYPGYNPLPVYTATGPSQAKVYKQSVATLSGGSLRCVEFAVLASCGPANVTSGCSDEAFGNGFSRLRMDAGGNPTPRAAQIMQLPVSKADNDPGALSIHLTATERPC